MSRPGIKSSKNMSGNFPKTVIFLPANQYMYSIETKRESSQKQLRIRSDTSFQKKQSLKINRGSTKK